MQPINQRIQFTRERPFKHLLAAIINNTLKGGLVVRKLTVKVIELETFRPSTKTPFIRSRNHSPSCLSASQRLQLFVARKYFFHYHVGRMLFLKAMQIFLRFPQSIRMVDSNPATFPAASHS